MATVSVKAYHRFKGPWLLDAAALKELEQELLLVWEDLNAVAGARLAEHVELRWNEALERADRRRRPEGQPALLPDRGQLAAELANAYPFDRKSRVVKVDFGAAETLVTTVIGELGSARELAHAEARSIAVEMLHGALTVRLSIERDELVLHAYPEHDPSLQGPVGRLLQWAEKHGPRPALVWWREWKMLAWLAALATYFVAATVFSSSGKATWRGEAHRLLSEGVGEANRDRALEVLLGLASEVSAETHAAHAGGNGLLTSIAIFAPIVVLAMLSVGPTQSHFAFGSRGIRRVALWKWYTRWVFQTAPAWIAVTLAAAALQAAFF